MLPLKGLHRFLEREWISPIPQFQNIPSPQFSSNVLCSRHTVVLVSRWLWPKERYFACHELCLALTSLTCSTAGKVPNQVSVEQPVDAQQGAGHPQEPSSTPCLQASLCYCWNLPPSPESLVSPCLLLCSHLSLSEQPDFSHISSVLLELCPPYEVWWLQENLFLLLLLVLNMLTALPLKQTRWK